MHTINEMEKWNYTKAWKFFSENAVKKFIPESALYLRSLGICETIDVRDDKDARNKIMASLNSKSLILIDGASLNGKTTFANRLAKSIGAEVVDVDLICMDWSDEQLKKLNFIETALFYAKFDELTDKFLLENLEEIIKSKSSNTVILVGSYLE